MALRLDQALGAAAEPLSPLPPAPMRWARRRFAEPIVTPEAIAAAVDALLETLCRALGEEALGARRLTLACHRVDGEVTDVAIGTARPSRERRHLQRLLAERLETIDPGLGIEDMVLRATAVERLAAAQIEIQMTDDRRQTTDERRIRPLSYFVLRRSRLSTWFRTTYCYCGDSLAEELDGGFFAESAGLALKGDAHLSSYPPVFCLAAVIPWLTSFLLRRSYGGVTGWTQETRVLPRETAPYDEMKTERLQAVAWRCESHSVAETKSSSSIRETTQ